MARRHGEAYWQQHLETWERGDLTQEAYCTRHGLSTKSFYRWRCKQKAALAATKTNLTLVPVSVSPSPASTMVRLHSPGGWRIELPASNVPWLADVLRHLP